MTGRVLARAGMVSSSANAARYSRRARWHRPILNLRDASSTGLDDDDDDAGGGGGATNAAAFSEDRGVVMPPGVDGDIPGVAGVSGVPIAEDRLLPVGTLGASLLTLSACRNAFSARLCSPLPSSASPKSARCRARSALATASGGSRGDAEHRKPPSASALSHISAASNRSMARICWVDAMSPALSRDNADTDGGGSGRRAWVAGRRYGAPGYVPGARPGRINGHLPGPPDR